MRVVARTRVAVTKRALVAAKGLKEAHHARAGLVRLAGRGVLQVMAEMAQGPSG